MTDAEKQVRAKYPDAICRYHRRWGHWKVDRGDGHTVGQGATETGAWISAAHRIALGQAFTDYDIGRTHRGG